MEIEKILNPDFLNQISFFNFENAITAAFYTDQNLNLVRQPNPPEDVSAFQTRVNSWKVDGRYKFKGNYWSFDDLSDSEYLIATEYVKHENDNINVWKDLLKISNFSAHNLLLVMLINFLQISK